ncbi:MAG: potassium channel family protein [Chloroflexota bacterium]
MNITIMGCGRVGAELAHLMDSEGHNVTILDTDASSFDKLPPDFGGTALLGHATDEEGLEKANIRAADAFVAVTREDDKNAMAAQIAREIFGVRKVICRIYDPQREEFYASLGLEAISPVGLFARLIRDRLEA